MLKTNFVAMKEALKIADARTVRSEGFKYSCQNLWGPAEAAAKEVVKSKIRAFALMD